MKKILFFGDSITDCGRTSPDNNNNEMGWGYANQVKTALEQKYPNEYQFFNRGIGGNRIVDLYARIKRDVINYAPDYISILIGVNDVWHELDFKNGVSNKRFEQIYSMIIEDLKEALPETKIAILEPYVLIGTATVGTQERWNAFSKEVSNKAAVSKKIAEKFDLPFIPLQALLEEKNEGEKYLVSADGVHPNNFGHEIIAKEWLDCFEKNK